MIMILLIDIFLNDNINNVNSINVDIFRKINTTSTFNNCLFYFDEQIPPNDTITGLNKPWEDSRALFISGLSPPSQ
jgi:hypothetical protein